MTHPAQAGGRLGSNKKRSATTGIQYGCVSVCIPASYVRACADYVKGRIPVCTVIGFPNGYTTTETKVFETEDAVRNGADEIDMVVNLGCGRTGAGTICWPK